MEGRIRPLRRAPTGQLLTLEYHEPRLLGSVQVPHCEAHLLAALEECRRHHGVVLRLFHPEVATRSVVSLIFAELQVVFGEFEVGKDLFIGPTFIPIVCPIVIVFGVTYNAQNSTS